MSPRRPLRRPLLAPLVAVLAALPALHGCSATPGQAEEEAGVGAAQEQEAARGAINPATPRPYSEAYRVGDTYWFSGKLGITAETRNIMEAFDATFQELGIEWTDVVKATVFLSDIEGYDAMNEVYGEYFPSDPPARETVAVAGIVADATVEISFVAVKTP